MSSLSHCRAWKQCSRIPCILIFFIVENTLRAETVNDVLAAWEKRNQSIASLDYECDLETTVVDASARDDGDPFDDRSSGPREPKVRRHQSKVYFTMAGKRIAYRRRSQKLFQEKESVADASLYQAVFDGRDYRTLHSSEGVAIARINHDGEPGPTVTVEVTQIAFHLAHDPASFLSRVGCDLKQLAVHREHVNMDGADCVELTMPRKAKSPWLGYIYVDPKREFVPVKWREDYDGILMHDDNIQYIKNDKVGWTPTLWSHRQFGEDGKIRETLAGKVARCTVNGTVDERTFVLIFPIGTHVLDESGAGRKFFRQGDHDLIPVSELEFGKDPKSVQPHTSIWRRVFLVGTFAIVIVLALALLLRRRGSVLRRA